MPKETVGVSGDYLLSSQGVTILKKVQDGGEQCPLGKNRPSQLRE